MIPDIEEVDHEGKTTSILFAEGKRPECFQCLSKVEINNRFLAPLLPEGYPHSVSKDYAAYQFWDTVQCMCSSITGTLSTRAVLTGVGVGHSTATAMSGTLSFLLRDCSAMIGRIWLASHFASNLDNNAKMWRLFADITNDIGMIVEIFSVHLPRSYFLICICIASIFKAICGVAGGSSRAALTQHFCLRNNLADVAAKDGSQETVASLIGMLLGMLVAWMVPETGFFETTCAVLFCTGLHVFCNYRGVRALRLPGLNQNRMHICAQQFAKVGTVPSVSDGNTKESVWPWLCPFSIHLGATLASASPEARQLIVKNADLLRKERFICVRSDMSYVFFKMPIYSVFFSRDATESDYFRAFFSICHNHIPNSFSPLSVMPAVNSTICEKFSDALRKAGWSPEKLFVRIDDFRLRL